MKVITADPTGLCFGVKRAITTLEEELRKSPAVYALGSPIHNPQEIARLTEMGLVVVEKPEDVPEMAKRAAAEGNPLYPVPRLLGEDELAKIYGLIM